MPTKPSSKKWTFKARFRRHAFGWNSQPAIQRIKQATRKDNLHAAEGAVVFLERLSPALERVDSSSGAVGTAVNNAIAALVPIISQARVVKKLVAPSTNRNIKVVAGAAREGTCYAPLHRFRNECAEPSGQWAVFELFDPFFGSLKYTSVCPNHFEHFLEADVDLMAAESEVLLGLA
jgi:hypothetical protein